jgi:hypothetical protein
VRVSDKTLQAMARLDSDSDFQEVMTYFRSIYDECIERCIHEHEPARHQGAAQMMKQILKTLDGARGAARSRLGE